MTERLYSTDPGEEPSKEVLEHEVNREMAGEPAEPIEDEPRKAD